jgi:hypothetical protein
MQSSADARCSWFIATLAASVTIGLAALAGSEHDLDLLASASGQVRNQRRGASSEAVVVMIWSAGMRRCAIWSTASAKSCSEYTREPWMTSS